MTALPMTTDAPAADVRSLVPRYVDLVYATARRIVGDAHLAEDVAQAAFIVLMRKADRVDPRTLAGWLVNTTRLAANEALRSQGRRRSHESRAARLRPEAADEPTAADVLPLLDEAMSHLSAADRTAVVLRYLHGRTFAPVAAATGSTQEASRKRVDRAVEKLRVRLTKRGVAPGVAGLTVILAAAQSPPASAAVSAAVVAALTTPTAAGLGPLLAKGTLSLMKWSQIKLAALFSAVAVTAVGGVWVGGIALARTTDGPAVATAATAPAPPVDKAAALAELARAYALADDQVLRLIEPPFVPARQAWADAEFPYARGAANIRSLGFTFDGTALGWTNMSYADEDVGDVVDSVLQEPWYRADGLDVVRWQPVHGDLVVRDGATPGRKFDALADLITRRTGTPVRFVPHTRSRPCVILRGKTGQGPDNGRGFHAVALSLAPLDRETVAAWGRDRPRGGTHAFQFDRACKSLAAPFFKEPAGPADHGSFEQNSLFPIGPDARLDPAAADYEAKLARVVANVEAQIGGDWSVERRDVETYTLQRVP